MWGIAAIVIAATAAGGAASDVRVWVYRAAAARPRCLRRPVRGPAPAALPGQGAAQRHARRGRTAGAAFSIRHGHTWSRQNRTFCTPMHPVPRTYLCRADSASFCPLRSAACWSSAASRSHQGSVSTVLECLAPSDVVDTLLGARAHRLRPACGATVLAGCCPRVGFIDTVGHGAWPGSVLSVRFVH